MIDKCWQWWMDQKWWKPIRNRNTKNIFYLCVPSPTLLIWMEYNFGAVATWRRKTFKVYWNRIWRYPPRWDDLWNFGSAPVWPDLAKFSHVVKCWGKIFLYRCIMPMFLACCFIVCTSPMAMERVFASIEYAPIQLPWKVSTKKISYPVPHQLTV